MLDAVWLIPALPLAGFLLLLAFGRRLAEPGAGWLATVMCAGSFVATLVVFAGLLAENEANRRFGQILFAWVPVGRRPRVSCRPGSPGCGWAACGSTWGSWSTRCRSRWRCSSPGSGR